MESHFPQELVLRPLVRQKSHNVKIALRNPFRHPGSTTRKHITSQETPASLLLLQLGSGLCGLSGAAEETTGSRGTRDRKHSPWRVTRCWCGGMRPRKGLSCMFPRHTLYRHHMFTEWRAGDSSATLRHCTHFSLSPVHTLTLSVYH